MRAEARIERRIQQNPWSALRRLPTSRNLVPRVRLELTSEVFQTTAVTILATSAFVLDYILCGRCRARTYDLFDVNEAL